MANNNPALLARRTIYHTVALTIAMLAWFTFFTGVALFDVPVVYMFLLFVSSGSAFFVAYCSPIDPTSSRAHRLQFLITSLHMLILFVTFCGFFFALVSSTKEHSSNPGMILASASILIHLSGALGQIGNSPGCFESYDRMKDIESAMQVQSKMEALGDQLEEKQELRQEKREEREEEREEQREARKRERENRKKLKEKESL